ncbi:GerMN domain-containing protein [Glutamicibacter sp. MNS18]|uniref:GerMN domain-containing protein n=1 Tax=Glutamicibacter sp. MNS18 TaxID=2989817 RepID=UPI002236AEA3|nr:GerMN domain-containing protein [Glutamicibacter sp. MNS18]MCW4465891.1 GerMN domain-containing protein [Glutamicibacter sp. MNS18]
MASLWIRRIAGVSTLGLVLAVSGCTGGSSPDPDQTTTPPATATTSAPPDESPSPSPTTAALTLFYVAIGDEGVSGPEIGCGDSIVATESTPVEFTDQVEVSMSTLLADDEREHGASGLQNTLVASDLEFVAAQVAADTVTVDLTGQVVSGGACDDPRIIEQLKYTAMTAAGTGSAEILVDGEAIEDVLSNK